MQVGDNSHGKESMAWLRILENILVVADPSKLTRAMGSQWCSTVCRCLSSLLRNKGKDDPHRLGIPTVDDDTFVRQGNGCLAAGRQGRPTTQPDPRHTQSFPLQCPLTRHGVFAASRTCDPPVPIATANRAEPPPATTASRARTARGTDRGRTAPELGRDRGDALAGCHVSGRRWDGRTCMGDVDDEVGRMEGARWGRGKSSWRVGEEGGPACAP